MATKVINRGRRIRDMIVIAGSAGGIESLKKLLRGLPATLPATLAVVIHRSPVAASHLADVLQKASTLRVIEPAPLDPLEHGSVYLAPRDLHMQVVDGSFALSRGPKEHHTRPAADPLFTSAAASCGPRVVGVVLSGAGYDGVTGCVAIKERGGIVLVQDPGEATMPWMPRSAIAEDHVDGVMTITELAPALVALAAGRQIEPPPRPVAA
jgi:two-component system, chemotaxis family, protein-glutamate methylesterase/glutaminase